ncbi:MAG TPA: PadR family transcriptional regulator [Acidimicrobiia bacterium]|nr:PadR family transcriptional regulator [Acidimicrobiia bacterium]
MRKLTPTSYAILGLLALRPWSAYELTKQVRRSLHFCWPRAETRLYQEPKNLVEQGLVKATTTAQGRRTRTEYAITARGRKALRGWLGQPSAPPRLESEALLRLFFADCGTKDELLATLAELEGQARALREQAVAQAAEYLGGPHLPPGTQTAPFPERIHILAVLGRFTLDHTALVAEWARWARAEVEGWPDTATGEVSPDVIRAFEEALRLQSGAVPADR